MQESGHYRSDEASYERDTFKTILCSENALFREGLARILSDAEVSIVCSNKLFSGNASTLLRDESRVLLLIDASDDFDAAISQIEYVKLNYPHVRSGVLVGRHQLHLSNMILAFRSGVSAYLTNFMTPVAFVKSLELVMLGETIFPIGMLPHSDEELEPLRCDTHDYRDNHRMNVNANEDHREENACSEKNDAIKVSCDREGDQPPHLSARQTAILRCLLEGHSNKVIARKMKIADATVKVHIKTILRKIRAENRTQAALWAMRNMPLVSPSHNGASIIITS
jgi:two-component system, NarL family, nitrate/nitrite response regulator NarL